MVTAIYTCTELNCCLAGTKRGSVEDFVARILLAAGMEMFDEQLTSVDRTIGLFMKGKI